MEIQNNFNMLKGFKYRLYPSDDQKELLDKHFGCTRFIYNLALETKINAYINKINLSRYDLQKQIVDLKQECEWLKEVNSQSLQISLLNLDNAYKRFFQTKKGFPRFKKKSSKNTFSVPQSVSIDKNELFIPKFDSGIKMIVKDRKYKGQIKSATISKSVTGKYFVSILCETGEVIPEKRQIKPETTIGIDLGIKNFLVFSNGRKISNSNFFKNNLEFLKFLQRKLSKQNKNSTRYNKTKQRLALHHEHITNQRQDFLHKLSTEITNQYDTICVEDLNVKGMMKNHKLAQLIMDVSWSEFTRMITYKSEWKGKNVVRIPRFYPSSKTCHVCGYINKELTLKIREWI